MVSFLHWHLHITRPCTHAPTISATLAYFHCRIVGCYLHTGVLLGVIRRGEGETMPRCTCGGQRTTLGIIAYLKQGLLFTVEWTPWSLDLKNSPVGISHLSVGEQGLQTCRQLYPAFTWVWGSSLRRQACTIGAFTSEPPPWAPHLGFNSKLIRRKRQGHLG